MHLLSTSLIGVSESQAAARNFLSSALAICITLDLGGGTLDRPAAMTSFALAAGESIAYDWLRLEEALELDLVEQSAWLSLTVALDRLNLAEFFQAEGSQPGLSSLPS
jgi:hypothetical protein